MLELSFIFLVFLCLMMGCFDFGQFLFVHQALVERARYAARWGMATYPAPTNTEIQNVMLYGTKHGRFQRLFWPDTFDGRSNVAQYEYLERACFNLGYELSI